ncbi:flippase-like domain-containing protein [Candidatus Poribacteria bacterium]|nr:flippase-like domain-containing protein [Candidatus Poribacteria bacterium]
MRKTKRLLPFIGLVLLTAILARYINFSHLINLRQQAEGKVLGVAVALTIPFLLCKALKWYYLLRTSIPNVSYVSALRSFLIGMAASLFTPARLGELARVACFPSQRFSVLGLVMVDKLVDIGILLGLFVLSFLVFSPWLGLTGVLAGGVLVFGLSVLLRSTHWVTRIPQPTWLTEVWRGLRNQPRRLITLNASLTCLCFGCMMLQFQLFLSSLQSVSWWAGLMLPIILLVSSAPVSISGLGLREGITVLLLSRYAVSIETAIAVSLSVFAVTSLLPGLIGLLLSPTLIKLRPQDIHPPKEFS